MSAKSISVVAGEWYYGIKCAKCKQKIAIAHDRNKGAKPIVFLGPGILSIACLSCGHEGSFARRRLGRSERRRSTRYFAFFFFPPS